MSEPLEAHLRLLRRELATLRHDSALWRALFQECPLGIAVYSALQDGEDFVFVDLNPAGEQMVAMSRDAVVGRLLGDLFPGVRAMGLTDALAAAWRTGTPQRLSPREYRDGRIRLWAENHIVRLSTGHVASFFFDVTPWVESRIEERRGIVRFRRLYGRLHEGFCFVDAQGRVAEANPAMEALLGAAPGGLVGRRWAEMVAPDFRSVAEVLARLLEEQGSSPALELELVGATGPVPVHLSAYREEDGWWAMIRDATEARRLRELAAWRQMEESIFASLGLALLETDDLRELGQQVVEAAVRLTGSQYGYAGYLREDGAMVSAASSAAMEQCRVQGHPLVFERLEGLWAESLRTGTLLVVDDVATHPLARGLPPGHVPITSFCACPVLDRGRVVGQIAVAGAPAGYREGRVARALERLAMVYALALRRSREQAALREQERQQAEEVARQARRLAQETVARLVQPAEILLDLAASLDEQPLDARQRGFAEGIVECARGLARGLRQAQLALDEEIPLHETVFDLHDALRGLVARLRPQWAAKGLTLDLHIHPELPVWVRGDVGKLVYLLEQLLDNALAHTTEGGARLTAFAMPAAQRSEVLDLRLCVEDTGTGIPEGQQASIAAFFAQGCGEGVGTGLTVVRRLLAAMGGAFHLASRVGQGTTACATVPVHQAASPAAMAVVLVVDDEPLQRHVLRRLLVSLGDFAVHEAGTGAEALHLLAREPVHLALVDVDLPDMSGVALARHIRHREHAFGLPPLPVWLVTGFAPDELPALQDPELGPLAHGVLQKPVEAVALRVVLREAGLPVVEEWDEAGALAQLGGNVELLADLRRVFLQEAPQRLAEAEAALARGDVATALRAVHALKGNAATVGAVGASSLARTIHEALRQGQVAEAATLLPALRRAVDSVVVSLVSEVA